MQVRTVGFFWMAAFFEIAGCFAFWAWFRLGRAAWWTLAGTGSLVLFALCLARVDASYAGRAFAAYGGIYIVSSLAWRARSAMLRIPSASARLRDIASA